MKVIHQALAFRVADKGCCRVECMSVTGADLVFRCSSGLRECFPNRAWLAVQDPLLVSLAKLVTNWRDILLTSCPSPRPFPQSCWFGRMLMLAVGFNISRGIDLII